MSKITSKTIAQELMDRLYEKLEEEDLCQDDDELEENLSVYWHSKGPEYGGIAILSTEDGMYYLSTDETEDGDFDWNINEELFT